MLYNILRKEIMSARRMFLQTCLSFTMVFLLGFLALTYWNYTKVITSGHDIVFSGNLGEGFRDWQVIERGGELLNTLENTVGIKAYGILMSPLTQDIEPLYVIICSEQFVNDILSPYIVYGSSVYGENIIWLGKDFAALSAMGVGDTLDGGDTELTVGAIVDRYDVTYNRAMFLCMDNTAYNKILINFDAKDGKKNYYSFMHQFNDEQKLNGYAEEPYRDKEKAWKQMMLIGFALCAFAFFFEVLPTAYLLKGQQRKMAILYTLGYRREKIIKVYLRVILTPFLVSCLLANLMTALATGLKGNIKPRGIMQYAAYGKEYIFFQGIVAVVLLLISVLSLTAFTRNSRKALKIL